VLKNAFRLKKFPRRCEASRRMRKIVTPLGDGFVTGRQSCIGARCPVAQQLGDRLPSTLTIGSPHSTPAARIASSSAMRLVSS
jgi:hypothetical protein